MLYTHDLPDLATPADLAGGLVIVIDVLRASTTICHALAAGARGVIPCFEVDEARQQAASLPPGEAVLGGERLGLCIEGFQMGNSPSEYTPESVGGRTVIFTTTNGTRAMQQCRQAARVLIGGFVNLAAICREVRLALAAGRDAHLLCAGTRGEITGEDVLFAGAVVHHVRCPNVAKERHVAASLRDARASLGETRPRDGERHAECAVNSAMPLINDQAHLAELAWLALVSDRPTSSANALADHLAEHTHGGRNVASLGLAADILAAATIDRFDFVPELSLSDWQIKR